MDGGATKGTALGSAWGSDPGAAVGSRRFATFACGATAGTGVSADGAAETTLPVSTGGSRCGAIVGDGAVVARGVIVGRGETAVLALDESRSPARLSDRAKM